MKRVEIPEKPTGFRPRRGRPDPHETLASSLQGLAMAYGGEDQLRGLAILATFLDDMIATEVAERREYCSWTEVGASLGVSKQAAQQKYGRSLADSLRTGGGD